MKSFKKLFLGLALMTLLALNLVACGGGVENTPAPANSAAPTAAIAPTTAANQPVTTAAANKTSLATTAAASQPVKSGSLIINGAKEVTIDPAIRKALNLEIPGIADLTVKIYVSDDSAEKLTDNFDMALKVGGYKFAMPGKDKPDLSAEGGSGAYTKAGAPDITFTVTPLKEVSSPKELQAAGISEATIKGFLDQFNNKKSVGFFLSAPGLVEKLSASSSTNTTTATTTTAAATTAAKPAAATAAAGKVGQLGMVKQSGYVLTVNTLEKKSTISVAGLDLSAKAGFQYITLDVTILSEADEDVDANTLYATLKDANGASYNASLLGREPELPTQNNVAKGQMVRGWLTFEVPKSTTGLVFIYEPLSLEAIKLQVPLGQ